MNLEKLFFENFDCRLICCKKINIIRKLLPQYSFAHKKDLKKLNIKPKIIYLQTLVSMPI